MMTVSDAERNHRWLNGYSVGMFIFQSWANLQLSGHNGGRRQGMGHARAKSGFSEWVKSAVIRRKDNIALSLKFFFKFKPGLKVYTFLCILTGGVDYDIIGGGDRAMSGGPRASLLELRKFHA